MTDRISRDRADEALRLIYPVIHPALSQCLLEALTSSSDDDGNFDQDKFSAKLKDCIDSIYADSHTSADRVTIGKAAAIAQALFMAMISR